MHLLKVCALLQPVDKGLEIVLGDELVIKREKIKRDIVATRRDVYEQLCREDKNGRQFKIAYSLVRVRFFPLSFSLPASRVLLLVLSFSLPGCSHHQSSIAEWFGVLRPMRVLHLCHLR